MSRVSDDVNKAVILLHRKTGKEWIHLKEIYEEVSLLRNEKLKNDGATIRKALEINCKASKAFNGTEKYILKEKRTGLYKSIYYSNLLQIEELKRGDTLSEEELMSILRVNSNSSSDEKEEIQNDEMKEVLEKLDQIEKTYDNVDLKGLIYKEGIPKITKYKTLEKKQNQKTKSKYLAEQIIKDFKGRISERVVFEYEVKRLEAEKAYEQIEIMKEFFENKKENEGYDILTFELDKNKKYMKKYIEVKSTKNGEATPIDMTVNEKNFLKDNVDNYYLYRVLYSDREKMELRIIKGEELLNKYEFIPTVFKIYLK